MMTKKAFETMSDEDIEERIKKYQQIIDIYRDELFRRSPLFITIEKTFSNNLNIPAKCEICFNK